MIHDLGANENFMNTMNGCEVCYGRKVHIALRAASGATYMPPLIGLSVSVFDGKLLALTPRGGRIVVRWLDTAEDWIGSESSPRKLSKLNLSFSPNVFDVLDAVFGHQCRQ